MAGKGKKTFVAGEVLLAQDVNDYLMDQTVMNFASDAARSSAIPTPTEGMFAVTTDNDQVDYYNGSDWVPALPIGAWQTWAPTLQGGWANGNGTWSAQFCQIGKIVHVYGKFTVGSTTTKGSDMRLSVPVTARSFSQTFDCYAAIGSPAQVQYSNIIRLETTTQFRILAQDSNATYLRPTAVTATVPATWATNDQIAFQMTYEAA
jgi:hypothetical protein